MNIFYIKGIGNKIIERSEMNSSRNESFRNDNISLFVLTFVSYSKINLKYIAKTIN